MVIWKMRWAILFLFFSGCTPIYDYTCAPFVDYFYPDAQTFHLTTLPKTNDHRPVYFLVKITDFASFIVDDYPAIVTAIGNPSEDPSIIATFCLLPGTTTTFQYKVPPGKGLAFYALYTTPKADWKYLINTKEEYHTVNVLLGEHEIVAVEVK